MNFKIVSFCVAITATTAALANPFYLRGSFNGYDTSIQLTDMGGNIFEGTATGLTAGDEYTFKVANEDYSIEPPGAFKDLKARANSAGEISVRFFNNPTPGDGWTPENYRVGLLNLGKKYELIGSMTGWSSALAMADTNGYQETIVNLTAGTEYTFKFRGEGGDWGYDIGQNFAYQDDIRYTASITGDHYFRLDVENGRYTVEAVPEPATLTLLSLGALAAIRRKRA